MGENVKITVRVGSLDGRKKSVLKSYELIVVAGRPSMGKTTFALNLADHAAVEEKKEAPKTE